MSALLRVNMALITPFVVPVLTGTYSFIQLHSASIPTKGA